MQLKFLLIINKSFNQLHAYTHYTGDRANCQCSVNYIYVKTRPLTNSSEPDRRNYKAQVS